MKERSETSSPGIQVTRENGRRGYTGCPRRLGENVFPTEASETINPMPEQRTEVQGEYVELTSPHNLSCLTLCPVKPLLLLF